MNYWLLLEKSDETRISKGINGYQDQTGEIYHFDSLVPNHKNVAEGDFVVLRKENEILGFGEISGITESDDVKTHRRCISCRSTDIRKRLRKSPSWKCGKCGAEFEAPDKTSAEITSYHAEIRGFTKFSDSPSVIAAKACAQGGDGTLAQLSMLKLDPEKLQALFEGLPVDQNPKALGVKPGGQGLGLTAAERRAVELRAMDIARRVYELDGWEVIDTSASRPYDLVATKDGTKRFIEVKGTTGPGAEVILTRGEVNHASSHWKESALIVISAIELSSSGEQPSAHSGSVSAHITPWNPASGSLEPTQFRYQVNP